MRVVLLKQARQAQAETGAPAKGSDGNEISFPLMCTPSAELEDPLDAARVGLFHLRLQLCTETVLVYAQQKTEMEKLNALELQRFPQLQLSP